MFGILRKTLIVLLASIINASNHTKYVLLSNQKWKIQTTLINLYQEFLQYPYAVKLVRCFFKVVIL